MYKLYKCMLIALLAVAVILVAGCKQEQSVVVNNQNTIQLPDGMEVQMGVGTRDEEDLGNPNEGTQQGGTGEETPDNDPTEEIPDDSQTENPNGGQSGNTQPDNKPDDDKQDDTQLPVPGELDFEGWLKLSGDQQDAYVESFESLSAFNKWYNAALAEYESQLPEDEIIDGEIDLGKYNP